MNKHLLFVIGFFLFSLTINAQVYLATGGKCSFHSTTPVEDIDATSESMNSVINAATGEIQFKVPLTSFHFKKALMQEHFNEKYVESEKYPFSTFKGKINEPVNLSKDGTYEITATGVYTIHGIDKSHSEKATLTIKSGKMTITGSFKVALKDHNIEIPKIVLANIAEIIDVSYSCSYTPYQK
ncbi:MAG: YceI family protein [Bacteroidota bacterium]